MTKASLCRSKALLVVPNLDLETIKGHRRIGQEALIGQLRKNKTSLDEPPHDPKKPTSIRSLFWPFPILMQRNIDVTN